MRRRTAVILALPVVAVAIPLILPLILAVVPPRPARPALALDVPQEIAAASAEFAHRLASAFPAGTPLPLATATLSAQGFRLRADGSGATWEGRTSVWCREMLTIRWRTEAGRLAEPPAGRVGLICL